MADIETTKKRIMRVATKKPLLARDIAEKLDSKYPGDGYGDARSFGRSLGQLVKAGKIKKLPPKSRPQYAKV